LASYPDAGRHESNVRRNVDRWTVHGDVIVMGFVLDGIGRWDVPVGNPLAVDLSLWKASERSSSADGENGVVRVLHAPNHRGAKGSEFIIAAVERLQARGYGIELVLAERVQNERIRDLLQEVDILADQL